MFKPKKIPAHRLLDSSRTEISGKRFSLKSFFLCLLLAVLAFFLLALIVEQKAYAVGAETPTEFERLPDDSGAGELFIRREGEGNRPYKSAIHLSSELDANINGMLASISLKQQFKNDSSDWVEATYVLPLPETSAVDAMTFIVGERVIKGVIKEREQAKKIYQAAKASGKKAAIVSQQRPNLFTQKVANIAPGETVQVEIHYLQKVEYRRGRFSWRMPMTLTPRFIPGAAQASLPAEGRGWARPTDQVPDADLITPPMRAAGTVDGEMINPISFSIVLNAGLPLARIHSAYHELAIEKVSERHHIKLAKGRVPMDRDFELTWQPIASNQPEGAVFIEEKAGEHFALLMLMPPQASQEQQAASNLLPREVMYIIDTSGSMGGDSIRQAKKSLQLALSRLTPKDRFNVIEFNSHHRALFSSTVEANEQPLRKAQQFVARLQAGGGTNMAPALSEAFKHLRDSVSETHIQQVVFVTDGSVGNEAALLSLIEKDLGRARLFTVGIGSAPNSFFMHKAAQFGRGNFSYVGDLSEVKNKMSALFEQLESPIMTQLDLKWPKGIKAESWPQRLQDLYRDEPMVITAKLSAKPQANQTVTLSGLAADKPWSRSLSLKQAWASEGLGSVWARDKISSLMDRKHRGEEASVVKAEVLSLALKHSLLSAYTSFVAVEQKVTRPVGKNATQESVPNLVAKGQTLVPVSLPNTATGAPISLLLGGFLLGLALWLRRHAAKVPA